MPLAHEAGAEAEVDWCEADVDFPAGRERVQFFAMRSCFSGRDFHMAFPRQTQQAFLEALCEAFAYFGGAFGKLLRFDNLTAAVKHLLRGRRRVETDRFVALRSHFLFGGEFCVPGQEGAHEKGGVEGGLGCFRRNHLVPVPKAADFGSLNRWLLDECALNDQRTPEGGSETIGALWQKEKGLLLALPAVPFDAADVTTPRVDKMGRICVGAPPSDASPRGPFLSGIGVTYPNFGATAESLGAVFSDEEISIPFSVLLDSERRVVEVFAGWDLATRKRLAEQVLEPAAAPH